MGGRRITLRSHSTETTGTNKIFFVDFKDFPLKFDLIKLCLLIKKREIKRYNAFVLASILNL